MLGKQETVFLGPPTPPQEQVGLWWSGYSANLADELTPTALDVVTADCRYIVERGVFGAGEPGDEPEGDSEGWPKTRTRSGLVIGAVQSGKTASMFGVIAQSLDLGADMVIVLSGTRLALWSQTFDRFSRQVDCGDSEGDRRGRRILIPSGPDVLSQAHNPALSRLYSVQRAQVREALADRRPIISFVLKNKAHLNALARSLRDNVYPLLDEEGRPFHLVVIDDEADDGSILDALAEEGEDPIYGSHKQTPRAIARLWTGANQAEETASPNLYATYVAYTATPQANLKQSEENPLAPRDFVVALRTPAGDGDLAPRHSSFKEVLRLPKFYTGGSVFYEKGREAGLCQETTAVSEADLDAALRAYLVAGAVRLARRAGGCGPRAARGEVFTDKSDLVARAGRPHTMLIHPSGMVQDQFDAAAGVLTWAGIKPARAADLVTSGTDVFLPTTVGSRVIDDEEPWRFWYESYRASAIALQAAFDLPHASALPPWGEVREALIAEVIPGTRVSVVNSDDRADNRPQFEPVEADGGLSAPRDLATIFVAGNVMSRGLTLDGLTTTLFLRQSQQPFADTQMQMQRWFGYRGSDLELCRVFLPEEQLKLFRRYHENDEAQRRQVISAMNASEDAGVSQAPKPMVLHGADFLATGKIGGLSRQRLYPGPKPLTRFTNGVDDEDPNVAWLAGKFDASTVEVDVGGVRGVFLEEALELDAAAELLDELQYAGYFPDPASALADHWRSLEQLVGLEAGDALHPFYRVPSVPDGKQASVARDNCPHSVAAYLRLWSAALNRSLPGFFPTDRPDSSWSRVDLADRRSRRPRFRVGIRFGSQPQMFGPFEGLGFKMRPMERRIDADGGWDGEWGSRNRGAQFYGDELMDYHLADDEPPYRVATGAKEIRPFGEDGMILFHVLQRKGQTAATVAVGVCVPEGGPDHIPALIASPRA